MKKLEERLERDPKNKRLKKAKRQLDKDTKTVQVSIENQMQRKKVRERLSSEEGDQKYRKRKNDVEPAF